VSEAKAFWSAIVAAPLDRLPRLVYCDWLDERNDPRAAGLRVLAEYDRWPWLWNKGYFWGHDTLSPDPSYLDSPTWQKNHLCDRSELPHLWVDGLDDDDEESKDFDTLRLAMEAAADLWGMMSGEQQAKCLYELDLITGRKKPNPKADFAARTIIS
jgi:uncharacterized protein (TIGR02996 family)